MRHGRSRKVKALMVLHNAVASAATDEVTKEAGKAASETISQLVAKVLNQLSLSAWLPSAALVLIIAFLLELESHLKTG